MPASRAFDFDSFLTLPRLCGLALSPDGQHLAVSVQRAAVPAPGPGAEGSSPPSAFESSVWRIDLAGGEVATDAGAAPRRLTRWAAGERSPRYAPDGSLLFLAPRGGEGAGNSGERREAAPEPSELRRLPAGPGEADVVASPPAGVKAFAVARDSGRVVLSAPLHPGTTSWEEDEAREAERSGAALSVQLYEGLPVRYWDRWYGPRERHLFAEASGEQARFHQLTSGAGFALENESFDVAPDGGAVATTWCGAPVDPRDDSAMLVLAYLGPDGAPAERRVLLEEERVVYSTPAWAPAGDRIACVRKTWGTPERCEDRTLVVVDVDSGRCDDVLGDLDRWPEEVVWAPDGRSLYFTADDAGHRLPYRVDLDTGARTRLAADGAYCDLTVAPAGAPLYALRSMIGEPPHVVALDPAATDQEPRRLPTPGLAEAGEAAAAAMAGLRRHRVERVAARAEDGTPVPGWLLLPGPGDGPAPLVVFVHGGPLSSWNAWHWRWNPHLLAARGWAVLLPDPALSTGYGLDYIQRGWGRWGAEPYTDILALVDATCARADIDAERTAVMGGSFGGYMANWIAGHTDRFGAIVTHASLWHLEGFHGVTDMGPVWENEFGDRYGAPERFREWSPHRFVDRITTPMLVIQGERDFRVPVSESLALWTDLRRHGVPAAFLHFPTESHWVLSPQHSRVWYETVFAWLDHHVLGKPWQRPPLL